MVRVGDNSTAIRVGTDTAVNVEETAIVEGVGVNSRAISGMIQTRIRNSGGIRASGYASRAIVLDPGGATSGISDVENDGLISASGTLSAAIQVRGRSEIVNRDVIDASGTLASGVSVHGTDNKIDNSGLIQGRENAVAIQFADGGSDNKVSNGQGGAILALPTGFEFSDRVFGTAILGGDGVEQIANRGAIYGDVSLGAGDDSFIYWTGSLLEGVLDGGADSDEVVVKGDGGLTLNLDSIVGFESLELEASGTVDLQGTGDFPDMTLLRRGTVRVLEPVTLTGDAAQREGNRLVVGLQEGKLTVNGELRARGELVIDPQGFVTDDVYELIEATGGLDASFQGEIIDSALLTERFIRTPNELSVDITRNSYESVADTDNQREVAQFLDAITAPGVVDDLEPELDVLLGILDFQDRAGVLQGYDALSPEYYDAHSSTAFDMGREFDAVLRRPPVVCRAGDGPPEGGLWRPCGGRDLEPWFLGWGSYRDRDPGGDHIRYEQYGGGLAAGAQKRLTSWLEVGGGVGAARRHIDVHHDGRGSLTTADVGVNAAGHWGPVVVRAAASFGYGWHDARRDVDWPQVSQAASGDFDHQRVGTSIEVAPHFDFGALRIEPHAGLDYTWLNEEDVDESGAGALNLDVDERTNSLLAVDTGIRLRGFFYRAEPLGDLYDFSQTLFVPELRAGYRRVVIGADRDISAELEGVPSSAGDFDVDAEDAEGLVTGGVGLTAQPRHGATIGLFYDVQYGDDTLAHVGSLQVRIPLQHPAGGS
ncbi:MAG: autotransporter outer membrane beta-barrel domain-containing protein [Myxococcota bacterium]